MSIIIYILAFIGASTVLSALVLLVFWRYAVREERNLTGILTRWISLGEVLAWERTQRA